MNLHNDEQVHVPEDDDRKVVERVRGLFGLRVLEEIGGVEEHGGENGRQAEQHCAHVVEAQQLETVLAERRVAD